MDAWKYDPVSDLDQSLVERLKKFPREPDMLIYGLRSIAAVAMRFWLRTFHRLTIVHPENIPGAGSFVIVANHGSHLDAPCILSALPIRRLHRAFPAAAAALSASVVRQGLRAADCPRAAGRRLRAGPCTRSFDRGRGRVRRLDRRPFAPA